MASASRKFQAPKGLRDFYPQDMAVRRYIEGVWRKVSINHGFDEVDGPTFEDIELYKHKSGPGIVSEIFQVFSGKDEKEIAALRSGSDAPFALRPEFTPTLARMVAAKAAELPRPIKWFAIPSHFRAERPQRGRLREFMQWNVDFIGERAARIDAEVIACAAMAMAEFGLSPQDLRVKISDRLAAAAFLKAQGVPAENLSDAFDLIDKLDRIAPQQSAERQRALGISDFAIGAFSPGLISIPFAGRPHLPADAKPEVKAFIQLADEFIAPLRSELEELNIAEWCHYDNGIVRGLAYYTGTVFEIHEATGAERAIAGGGRYDNLIESFGGPSLPACGFGMGDVVLANILHDKNLLPEEVYMKPLRPHAFAIAASDEAEPIMRRTIAQLRRDGFHIRHSYKTTRNVGKLLGDANKARAMSAIIFGTDTAANPPQIDFKDLQSGSQNPLPVSEIPSQLKALIARNE